MECLEVLTGVIFVEKIWGMGPWVIDDRDAEAKENLACHTTANTPTTTTAPTCRFTSHVDPPTPPTRSLVGRTTYDTH